MSSQNLSEQKVELWIATSNQGKLREFERLLGADFGVPWTLHSQKELKAFTPPPENGNTFLENAMKKAKALHAVKSEAWVLADDSGLEVAGLNNLPGVHSARYAGPHARDIENTNKLLKMVDLRCPTKREAQFRCVLVLIPPSSLNQKELIAEGILPGFISKKAAGTEGFGYDPVFTHDQEKTLAQLSIAEKNQLSHRARAVQKLKELLKAQLFEEISL